jgi:hypothetical protein
VNVAWQTVQTFGFFRRPVPSRMSSFAWQWMQTTTISSGLE